MSASVTPEGPRPDATSVPGWARAVCAGLDAVGCGEVIYVPDNPLGHVLRGLADHPGIRVTLATREEEAFGIAAGVYLGGGRPAVLLQSSGLGNSLNALGSLLIPYQIPVVMIVSMRGEPGEWNAAQVPLGRAVPEILGALGIQHTRPRSAAETEAALRQAAGLAFGARTPAACLLSKVLYTETAP
jgi:sulfopyruvate decarboxylase subunit alpha